MLRINWLNNCEVTDVNVGILENFYNTFRTPTFLLRNISRVGIPKYRVLVITLRFFIWPLSLINAGLRIIIQLKYIEMVSPKRRDHLLQEIWTMGVLRHPLILQWHPRQRKIAVPRLKSKWKNMFYLLKQSMMHCLRLGKNPPL